MTHDELFLAVVSLFVASILAPMIIAWWNTRLRVHERQLERARQEGAAEARRAMGAGGDT